MAFFFSCQLLLTGVFFRLLYSPKMTKLTKDK